MDTDDRANKVHGKNHPRFGNRLRLALLTAACIQGVTLPAGRAAAAETAVVIGAEADPLERYAADQLCMYLGQLFEIDAQPVTAAPAAAETLLLVGSPTTNPAVASAVGDDGWPEVSDQGVILQRAGPTTLIIGGGSPAATMWAVYELVESWGVRFLLHEDVLPATPTEFNLPAEDVVLEPALRIRQWRVINDFACGPESWGMADYRPVIDQLAKLRFNRIYLSIYPWQPFLHVEVDGHRRQSATLWYNLRYPITDDMPGRQLFGDQDEFWNPDLPSDDSYEEFAAAGEQLCHNLMAYGHSRGMQSVLVATLTVLPPELEPLLPGAQQVHQFAGLNIVPSADTNETDPALTKLAAAVLAATVNTYPEADFVSLGMPEFRQWTGRCEAAWKALDAKYNLSDTRTLEEAIAAAEARTGYPGGASRAVDEVKGDIAALRFYDHLLQDEQALRDTQRPDMPIIFCSVAEELFPVLPQMLPEGSELMNFVDYTASRIVKRREVLGHLPGESIPSTLIYTLHDDNVGLLPQLTTGSLHELTVDLRRHGWAGFATRFWLISDHDPCVAYLSRAAWDETATPSSVYADQVRAACGPDAVPDMLELFSELEGTTLILEDHGLGLTFPVPGMIMKHWSPGELSAPLRDARRGYQAALDAAHRARDNSIESGHGYVDYWIGRLEFGVGYLDTIELVREAATAEKAGNDAEASRLTSAALDRTRAMLESYAGVARNQSDRGAIATMAEYVYRPLKQKASQ